MHETHMSLINPATVFVILIFLSFLGMFIWKVIYIKKELDDVISILAPFKKSDLIYRFQDLNEAMLSNHFIADYWRAFTGTLVFGDRVVLKTNDDQLGFDSVSQEESSIYCTADSHFFFNEDTLVNHKINHKFISSIPGILTGLGPLGTFVFIAIGFAGITFKDEKSTVESITKMMSSLEIAATISILAIGSSLVFIVVEKLMYYFFCKKPLISLQLEIDRLFDKITPEKFLIELLKESKKQNNSLKSFIQTMPNHMKAAFDQSITTNLQPYLENLIFSVNQLQEGSGNIMNDLFGSD